MAADERRQIRVVVDAFEGFTEDLIRRLTTEITAELIENTPVDTGWARANWVPQIGVPFTGNSDAVVPTSGQVSSQAGQQQSGVASLLGYKIELGQVYITNNVPYILRLNDGHSKQAPSMFVEQAIDRGILQTLAKVAARGLA